MTKQELIACFEDTVETYTGDMLCMSTVKAQKSHRIYKEGFKADYVCPGERAGLLVEESTTLSAARKYHSLGRTAILNFANPHTPGGGVEWGAIGQEACLCRSSNLYACLTDTRVVEEFYAYHQRLKHHFFTDRLIYNRDVTIFKTDDLPPIRLPSYEWFRVDVITCAAPSLIKRRYTNPTYLKELFKARIKNILEAAKDNGVEILILGAFGCGTFRNPPEVVAKAFYDVLYKEEYDRAFKKIIFAIRADGEALDTFKKVFERNAEESQYMSQDIGARAQDGGYFGKQFSVLGDSISTLEGYNPQGNNTFYCGETCEKTGVRNMQDTWWGKVIDFFGGELLVNDSWSGSRVTQVPQSAALFPSACSDERTSALHIGSILPDVIIVYLGTNDWVFGALTGNETGSLQGERSLTEFRTAYQAMLDKLRQNYPNSEIWCCTLCSTYIEKQPTFRFPYTYHGNHIESYNEIIRTAVFACGCKLVDLYAYQMAYDSLDGSHPTAKGMETLARMVIRETAPEKACTTLDCKGEHLFTLLEEYTGGKNYVCKKCGKIEFRPTNWPVSEAKTVPLDEISEKQKQRDSGMPDLMGTSVAGRYNVVGVLQKDSYFQTYIAKDQHTGRLVTLKACSKADEKSAGVVTSSLRRARLVSGLEHPAIPRVLDVIDMPNLMCIVREYIEGRSLQEIFDRRGAQPAEKVVDWGIQLCAVLDYLHSRNPAHIHRDIKPANIILTPEGEIRLIDFGLMRLYAPAKTQDEDVIGTVGYAPPEQYGTAQTDARSDIYALGVTLHQMVTGVDSRGTTGVKKAICQINPTLPKGLEVVLSKCLQENPAQRYQNCRELSKALKQCLRKKMFGWR